MVLLQATAPPRRSAAGGQAAEARRDQRFTHSRHGGPLAGLRRWPFPCPICVACEPHHGRSVAPTARVHGPSLYPLPAEHLTTRNFFSAGMSSVALLERYGLFPSQLVCSVSAV